MRKLLVFFIFFWVFPAGAISIQLFDIKALFDLMESRNSAILAVEDDRVYLNVRNIIVNEGGLFLQTGMEEWFCLSALFSGDRGIYTQVFGAKADAIVIFGRYTEES